MRKSSLLNRIALILVISSFVLYGLIFVIPFFPLSLAQKTIVISILVASGEATWWVSIAIVGKQAVTKYKKYLNPCNWFNCKKDACE